MKPIYKSLVLANMALAVTLSLQANVTSDGASTPQAVNAETLEGLKVELVDPNVSGARDLIASGECVISNDKLQISLDGSKLVQGTTYRILVQMEYGTNTVVLYGLNVTVPRYVTLESGTQAYADNVVVVSTFGGGDTSGADASVYAKDGDGNAHITKPLSINGSVQEGSPYGVDIYELDVVVLTPEQKAEVEAATGTAYDYFEANDDIPNRVNVTIYADEDCTQKVGSTAKTEYADEPMSGDFFNLQDGESIAAGTYYARVERGVLGDNSHAEGGGTTASGDYSHAEGGGTTASGVCAHAEGVSTTASGDYSHAEGVSTTASGNYSHADGGGTTASGVCAHAEGGGTTASGDYSHAEGNYTTASGDYSHAEGVSTTASGVCAHAEGVSTTASGDYSHAEGVSTTASGDYSHAEGNYTTASGYYSHAEGVRTTVSGVCAHAEGRGTVASQENQHVSGRYNIEDTNGDYALIVGNGADDSSRSNAFAIDWNGNLVLFNNGTPVVLTPAKLATLIA